MLGKNGPLYRIGKKDWGMERILMLLALISVILSFLVHLDIILTDRSVIPYGFILAFIFWGLSAVFFARKGPKSDLSFLFHKKQVDDEE